MASCTTSRTTERRVGTERDPNADLALPPNGSERRDAVGADAREHQSAQAEGAQNERPEPRLSDGRVQHAGDALGLVDRLQRVDAPDRVSDGGNEGLGIPLRANHERDARRRAVLLQ